MISVPSTTAELLSFLRDLYPAEEVSQAVLRNDMATATRVATIRGFLDEIEDLIEQEKETAAKQT